jgi:hypothetical protein
VPPHRLPLPDLLPTTDGLPHVVLVVVGLSLTTGELTRAGSVITCCCCPAGRPSPP